MTSGDGIHGGLGACASCPFGDKYTEVEFVIGFFPPHTRRDKHDCAPQLRPAPVVQLHHCGLGGTAPRLYRPRTGGFSVSTVNWLTCDRRYSMNKPLPRCHRLSRARIRTVLREAGVAADTAFSAAPVGSSCMRPAGSVETHRTGPRAPTPTGQAPAGGCPGGICARTARSPSGADREGLIPDPRQGLAHGRFDRGPGVRPVRGPEG